MMQMEGTADLFSKGWQNASTRSGSGTNTGMVWFPASVHFFFMPRKDTEKETLH